VSIVYIATGGVKAIVWTNVFQALMFLVAGAATLVFLFYAQHPGLPGSRSDEILPHFVQQVMPVVLRGFMLSAIVLASIDSPLGSLAASFVTDIYRPLLVRDATERHYLFVSRVAVVMFGLILGVIAYAFSFFDKILWLAFKIAGVTFGSLLGVFLLGLLSRWRIADRANVVAMITMASIDLVLLVLSETKVLDFAWSWLVILGTVGTMVLAVALTPLWWRSGGARGMPAEQ
jgi:SSS family solute:Na+ symporter